MNQPINLKTTTLGIRNPISPADAGRGFLLMALTLACFGLSRSAQAQDGDELNGNTAEGRGALHTYITTKTTDVFGNTAIGAGALSSLATGGQGNTAIGAGALQSTTTASVNTAIGQNALFSNTTGQFNTATGVTALQRNTAGGGNTASGFEALFDNTTGNSNTANGVQALIGNTTGSCNTATGGAALFDNSTGSDNTATGVNALIHNTTASFNTATGWGALEANATGSDNTAEGFQALLNSTGSDNIALGANAGINLTTGSKNIDIGAPGVAGESDTIRIGAAGLQKHAFMQGISGATVASGVTVIVGTDGHLGTVQSSARFKEAIKPMDKASEAILALQPVTFRYKHELDPDGIPQFGLVAEQVEKVNPDLVARDEKGKVYTVRYDAVNAMLLNEFLKEHRKVEDQGHKEQELEALIARQQKQIEALTATVEKVSDQMKLSKPPLQVVADNQ